MPVFSETDAQLIKIEYLQDTLFGVNPLTSECMARMVPTAPGLQLRLTQPWPPQLQHAHRIAFDWHGSAYRGVICKSQKLPTGDLLLEIEPQP